LVVLGILPWSSLQTAALDTTIDLQRQPVCPDCHGLKSLRHSSMSMFMCGGRQGVSFRLLVMLVACIATTSTPPASSPLFALHETAHLSTRSPCLSNTIGLADQRQMRQNYTDSMLADGKQMPRVFQDHSRWGGGEKEKEKGVVSVLGKLRGGSMARSSGRAESPKQDQEQELCACCWAQVRTSTHRAGASTYLPPLRHACTLASPACR
jgi:hypothetical protein